MTAPRTPSLRNHFLIVALAASVSFASGCGGSPAEVDTAETIRNEPAKPAPTPTPVPPAEATPSKEAPKG